MTVASTVAAVVLMPLVLTIYTAPFTGDELAIPLANVVTTLVAVLVPVSLGVLLRARRPAWALRAERVGSVCGIPVLALVIVSGTLGESERLFSFTPREILAGTALGPIGFACGWLGARGIGVEEGARRAICLETGIQNAPLAIGIVVASFSGDVEQEILRIPLLYGVLVVPASAAVAVAFRRS